MISIKKIKKYYNWGGRFLTNPFHTETNRINEIEVLKEPFRYDIINFLLNTLKRETNYLEIGVRNPSDNFNKINAISKYSVDPGIEFKENPVDFVMTSDVFFEKLINGEILNQEIRFDIIFIDGLHLADQVERDITNALKFIKEDGFIVMHDCNPPTEWHARESYTYDLSPARQYWNGTTWKAFTKTRLNQEVTSACIDTDWGIGVITKQPVFNNLKHNLNPYFEFFILDQNRKELLNLMSIDEFKLHFS